jgi:hypothetical protein
MNTNQSRIYIFIIGLIFIIIRFIENSYDKICVTPDSKIIDDTVLILLFFTLTPLLSTLIENFEFGTTKIKFIQEKQAEVIKEQETQKEILKQLSFVISRVITQYEYDHLKKLLNKDSPWIIHKDNTFDIFKGELGRLRMIELINNYPDKGIRAIEKDIEKTGSVNMHSYFYLTEKGKEYLKFRGTTE